MSKRSMWSLAFLVVLFCAAGIQAAESKSGLKGLTVGGDIEAGYVNSWVPSISKDSGWGVDAFNLRTTYDVTDRTRVVFNTVMAALSGTGSLATSSPSFLSQSYFPRRTLVNSVSATNDFALGVTSAYVEQSFTDNVKLAAGYFPTSFGMENMGGRYDLHSYVYSYAFTAANNYGWLNDVGLRLTLVDVIPGRFELEVVDGRNTASPVGFASTPGLNARYSYDWKNGDLAITPVISTVLNTWDGGPAEVGITAGAMAKIMAAYLNAEFVYTSRKPDPAGTVNDKVWDIYVEPGYDLGIVDVSAKLDYINVTPSAATTATTDWNVGAAISHTYNDKFRIRAIYEHGGLSGNVGGLAGVAVPVNQPAHVNHVAVLFGTKW